LQTVIEREFMRGGLSEGGAEIITWVESGKKEVFIRLERDKAGREGQLCLGKDINEEFGSQT